MRETALDKRSRVARSAPYTVPLARFLKLNAVSEGWAGMDVIAEHTFDVLYPNGKLVPVHIRIGRPCPHPAGRGDWGCAVQVDGLQFWSGSKEFFGEGSLHSLMEASTFVYRMLLGEVESGAKIENLDVIFSRSDPTINC